MLDPGKYRTLFLDLDHTLCDTDSADRVGETFLADLIMRENISPETKCLKASKEFMKALYLGNQSCLREENEDESSYRSRLMQFCLASECDHPFSMELCMHWLNRLMEKRIEALQFFDGVLPLLRIFRQKYQLLILTNGPVYSQKPKIEQLRAHEYVDHIVMCGEYAWQKPDPRIFQEALKISGSTMEEVIHIGDSLKTDIQGANKVALDSVWISAGKSRKHNDPSPTCSVEKFTDLAEIL